MMDSLLVELIHSLLVIPIKKSKHIFFGQEVRKKYSDPNTITRYKTIFEKEN